MISFRTLVLTTIGTFTLSVSAAEDFQLRENALRVAIIKGDLATVMELDPDGLNSPFKEGSYVDLTPEYLAAVKRKLAIVKYYVNKQKARGDEINCPMTCEAQAGLTPLYGAAYTGRLEIVDLYVRELESQHKDINAPLTGKYLGFTPFYIAVRGNQKNVIEYYIKKFETLHQNINLALTSGNDNGKTPLEEAIRLEHSKIVKIFVWRGLSLTDILPSGETPEHIAIDYRNAVLTHYLYYIAPLTQQLLNECYAVRDLLTLGDAASVQKATETLPRIRKLIRDGAEIEAQGKGGCTPLHCLIGYYDPQAPTAFDEMVKELIKSGKVDLKVLTDNGDSALTIAAKFGNSRIFKYLLAKGANPTIGNNPVIMAIEHLKSYLVRYLIMQY